MGATAAGLSVARSPLRPSTGPNFVRAFRPSHATQVTVVDFETDGRRCKGADRRHRDHA